MLAEKIVAYTDAQGHLTGLPTLQPNEKVEVILLRQDVPTTARSRNPPENLRGSVLVAKGVDLTAPLYSDQELA